MLLHAHIGEVVEEALPFGGIRAELGAVQEAKVFEMLLKQYTIVLGHSPDLIPALVAIEVKFLSFHFHLKTFFGKHVGKGRGLVSE